MLTLPDDRPVTAPLPGQHLPETEPGRIVAAIAAALPELAARLAAGKLPGDPAAIVGTNDSGDAQKALDVGAHEHLKAALAACSIRHMLSEEAEAVDTLNPEGTHDIAIDPIDGSGSIGIGAPLGLLFVLYPTGPADFARPGSEAVAAGYVSFGHSIDMGFTFRTTPGIDIATWDGSDFRISSTGVMMKSKPKTLAYNASNERHWSPGLQAYAADVRAGKEGPFGRDFNMRWLGAAVGDLHRIVLQGGCFLYPADRRKGYEQGRLRLAYEAVPMAVLMEAAGGAATDGTRPILDLVPSEPHQHCGLVFGAADEVELIANYIKKHG